MADKQEEVERPGVQAGLEQQESPRVSEKQREIYRWFVLLSDEEQTQVVEHLGKLRARIGKEKEQVPPVGVLHETGSARMHDTSPIPHMYYKEGAC